MALKPRCAVRMALLAIDINGKIVKKVLLGVWNSFWKILTTFPPPPG